MGWTLLRTAHSTFVKETEDFTCQLLTPEGVTFASPKGLGATWFTGLDYGPVIRMIDSYEDGDICITSDPYSGFVATHAPDTHIWKPIFHEGDAGLLRRLPHPQHRCRRRGAGLALARPDRGASGRAPHPADEAAAARRVRTSDLLAMIATNVRMPEQNCGDLNAQIAAVNTGERKLREMIARFGLETVRAAMPALLDYAEHQARQVIAGIPDGDVFLRRLCRRGFARRPPLPGGPHPARPWRQPGDGLHRQRPAGRLLAQHADRRA